MVSEDKENCRRIARSLGFSETKKNKDLLKLSLNREKSGLSEGVDIFIDLREGEKIYAYYWHKKGRVADVDLERLSIVQRYWQLKAQGPVQDVSVEAPETPSKLAVESERPMTPSGNTSPEKQSELISEEIGAVVTINLDGTWEKIPVPGQVVKDIKNMAFEENVYLMAQCLDVANDISEQRNPPRISEEDRIRIAIALFSSRMRPEHYYMESEILRREYIRRSGSGRS